jgi:hypothetical protein
VSKKGWMYEEIKEERASRRRRWVLEIRELISLTGLAKSLRMPSSSWMLSRSLDHIVR